jgi:SAM-dependent methyltransferase
MQSDFEEKYHRLEEQHAWSVGRRDVVLRAFDRWGIVPSMDVVEIGCASGALLADLTARGFHSLAAVEVSERAVERARARGGATVHHVDGTATPFADASFDALVASDVLEHIADEAGALAEWMRILRPGGLAFVFVPAFMALWSEHDVINRHERRYTLGELAGVCRGAGFEVLDQRYWNASLLLPTAAQRLAARVRDAARGAHAPTADEDAFRPLHPLANRAITALLRAENTLWSTAVRFPAGVSAAVVVRRPLGG